MDRQSQAVNLHEISFSQAADLPIRTRTAIFPIGSNEQHGPHLPTGTDSIILDNVIQGVREKLGTDFPAFFLPLLPYGKSPEHLDFPGTISLQATTLIAILEDIVSSLAPHGVKKIILLNSHGGNTALLNSIAYDLRQSYKISVYNLNLWGEDFFDANTIEKIFPNLTYPEVHAASIETSLLQYLRPQLVTEIPFNEMPQKPFPSFPCGWSTPDISRNGVIGDISGSSEEAGKRLYELTVDKVVAKLKLMVEN